MQVMIERAAGLDVHQETVVACVLTSSTKGKASQEVETFSTMTWNLERLTRWLAERGVEQVALEFVARLRETVRYTGVEALVA